MRLYFGTDEREVCVCACADHETTEFRSTFGQYMAGWSREAVRRLKRTVRCAAGIRDHEVRLHYGIWQGLSIEAVMVFLNCMTALSDDDCAERLQDDMVWKTFSKTLYMRVPLVQEEAMAPRIIKFNQSMRTGARLSLRRNPGKDRDC